MGSVPEFPRRLLFLISTLAGLLIADAAYANKVPLDLVTRTKLSTAQDAWIVNREAAICPDGSIWLFWTQTYHIDRFGGMSIDRRRQSADIGLFCSLVAPDGKRVVSATRILEPFFGHNNLPVLPAGFVPLATPEGGALLFCSELRDNPDRDHTVPPPKTVLASVSRQGEVALLRLEGGVSATSAASGPGRARDFHSWWDAEGRLHVLSNSESRIKYTVVRDGEISGALAYDEMFLLAKPTSRDSAFAFNSRREQVGPLPNRPALAWFNDPWNCAAIAPLGRDTIVVVCAPPEPESVVRHGVKWPGSTIVICRMLTSSFTVIDSARFPGVAVKGTDIAGIGIPRAILHRTSEGYLYLIARPDGCASYQLDATGRAVLGVRTAAQEGTPADFSGTGTQLLRFSRQYFDGPLKADWFGLTDAGRLCHESREWSDK